MNGRWMRFLNPFDEHAVSDDKIKVDRDLFR